MSTPQSPTSVLLYGAGSIGGVYLYQLLQAKCHVTAVCRSNYDMVRTHGFDLTSKRYGNVRYQPSSVIRDVSECEGSVFDYILVCTKAFPGSTPSLADQLRPVIEGHPQTVIVLAQNGMFIEEDIKSMYPENPVLSGVVYLPAVQTGPGSIDYPEMLNLLELGTFPVDAPAWHKEAANKFADLMIKGGGRSEVHHDIQVARWSKLLMNAAWNPIGALTLTTDGDFLCTSEPYAQDLAWGVMMELVEVAKAVGVSGVDVTMAEKKFATARERAKTGTGREMSMLQDVRQGRPFEVEAILGNPIRAGKAKGVSMPRLETLYALATARLWALSSDNVKKDTASAKNN